MHVVDDLPSATKNADVVYTDSWMSYRVPEAEREQRLRDLAPYRVDAGAMAVAARDAPLLHCLPALRGMEVTADVIDSRQSIVFDQGENRLHVEKATPLELLSSA